MAVDPGCFTHISEEVCAFLRPGKTLGELAVFAELVVAVSLRIHDIDANEAACESLETGVNYVLLLHPLLGAALLHLLVDIRHADNDEVVIGLHARGPHAHIDRLAVYQAAVGHPKGIAAPQGLEQGLAVHSLDKCFSVIRVHIFLGIDLAGSKEIRAMTDLCEAARILISAVFDKFISIEIHIEEIRITVCKRLRDVGIDDAVSSRPFVGFLSSGLAPPDAHYIRNVRAHAEKAKAPIRIYEFQLRRLELSPVAGSIRHVLVKYIRLIHGKRHLVILDEVRSCRRVKDLRVSEARHSFRSLLVGIVREGLVAGEVSPGLNVLREGHGRHVGQKRRNRA